MEMDIVLEQDDAPDWAYRGEGAANLVLAYAGTSPEFVGKVLRIQKAPKIGHGNKSGEDASALTSLEKLVWRENEELISSQTKEAMEWNYVEHVMSPLLGPKYVDAGKGVCVSWQFLESIERNVINQRPSWRVDAAKVDTLRDSALLMSDHSLFSHGISREKKCFSVEIKPKCGFLPFSRFISEENAIKRSTNRFRMHQALKFRQDKISELSEYDPLDLFSGSKHRIQKAIQALYSTPQNNFRVFINGSLVLGGLGGAASRTTLASRQTLEEALEGVVLADNGSRTESFIQLVAEAVYSSRVLDRLLEVQKLDRLDVEGAIHAYYNIVSQPCIICKEFKKDKVPLLYTSLHSIPLEESLKIAREYLIATTAKDCSVMISFRPRQAWDSASTYKSVYLDSTGQVFDFKIHFIDLDIKPLKKIEENYWLDKKIVSFYSQTLKTENSSLQSKRSSSKLSQEHGI